VLSNTIAESGKAAEKIVQQDRPDSAGDAGLPDLPPTPEEKTRQQRPTFPPEQQKPVYGPPSTARWSTSGTLDE